MSRRRTSLTLAAAGSVLVLLTACAGESASDTASNAVETASAGASEAGASASSAASQVSDSASSAMNDDNTAAANPEQHNAGAATAIDTAAQAAGGTAYAIDDADNDRNWEVDVWAGGQKIEVKVSGDGANVVEQGRPENDDDGARVEQARTTLKEAVEKALAEVPGALDDAELDEDNGTVVYEVTIDTTEQDDVDVLVNAADGSIVRTSR